MQFTGNIDDYANLCIADFTQAIAMDPETSGSYLNRAQCYLYTEEYEKGVEDLSMAIEKDPESYTAYLLRASLYPDVGTMEQALSDAQYVLDNSQDSELTQQAQLMLTQIPTLPTSTPAP